MFFLFWSLLFISSNHIFSKEALTSIDNSEKSTKSSNFVIPKSFRYYKIFC